MEKQKSVWKYEPVLFLLFIFISLLPVISSRFCPTIDGPAHLHNANLLRHLWFGEGSWLLNFFEVNRQLNSNWINHLWYVIAGTFLPSWMVEKSILVFYVVAFPLSFRYLAKCISGDGHSAKISSYLVFPFLYSFPFCIGFYNFCIGMPMVLWSIGYWLRIRETATTRQLLGLCLLITLTYLSHLFNFLWLVIILSFVFGVELTRAKERGPVFRRGLRLLLCLLPGLVLFLSFLYTNSKFSHDPPRHLSSEKLISMITEMGPLITLNLEKESPYVNAILYSFCVLIILAAIAMAIRGRERKQSLALLLGTLSIFVAFIVFPDWVSSGGFISVRWALFFFIMVALWITSAGIMPRLLVLPVAVILVAHTLLMDYHRTETMTLSHDAEEASSAEAHMEEHSVVLPLNYSINWIHINYGCYQVTEKEIVVLDNYEATKPHFPLLWKKGEAVYDLMKHYGDRNPPCIDIEAYENATKHRIDYISRWHFNGDLSDSCAKAANTAIYDKFELVYESPEKKLQLFKRKQK